MSSTVAVLGASGFAGADLLRIIEGHPEMKVVAAAASTRVGVPVADLYPSLASVGGMRFCTLDEALDSGADLIFSSLPHTASMSMFSGDVRARVVDLAGDFRLSDPERYREWYGEEHSNPAALSAWVYGLTEQNRSGVAGAGKVANPGCYATAALLGLLPLLRAEAIDPATIHIDAKSGISGAGRAGGEGFDYSTVNESTAAYAVTGHKHIAEMEEQLSAAAGRPVLISFVPHLVPMTRGILATCVAQRVEGFDPDGLQAALEEEYENEPFIRVLPAGHYPKTKRLSGTNDVELAVRADPRTGRVLVMAGIDNLVKGAAGQAVQNANLMLGLPETSGLNLRALVP